MYVDPPDHWQRAAQALRAARASRQPIAQISASHGISGLDEAYGVAELNTRARLAQGARIVGKKVGLTSVAVQQQLGVDQPDFGVLFDDMEYLDGANIPMARLMQPRIEAEVAFVLGADLPPHRPAWGEFLSAVGFALPALEIVDSAIDGWKLTLADTVADNASSGLYVLGDQPVAVGALDFGALGMRLMVDGVVAVTGCGAACLGHPLRAAWWLACTMAERGHSLRRGELILSGALGPMVPVKAGHLVRADFGDLGSVSCVFG